MKPLLIFGNVTISGTVVHPKPHNVWCASEITNITFQTLLVIYWHSKETTQKKKPITSPTPISFPLHSLISCSLPSSYTSTPVLTLLSDSRLYKYCTQYQYINTYIRCMYYNCPRKTSLSSCSRQMNKCPEFRC